MARRRRALSAARAVWLAEAALAAALAGCGPARAPAALRFWAFGREGEVVREMMPEFQRANPGLKVEVQQVPWRAAHEKLLTAFVGRTTPDLVQLGNTWIPELHALGALEPLDDRLARSRALVAGDVFPGIWETNVLDSRTLGIPWYVDTRVLFYRSDLLAAAGFPSPPRTWDEWRDALVRLKGQVRAGGFPILLPTDEWAQPVILGMQAGATLLRDGGRYGAFRAPEFRRAAAFYVSLFEAGLAPPVTNAQVSNVYQQIDTGDFAMWITGPWDMGNFRTRLAPARQDLWGTAPLPAPGPSAAEPGLSLAGGSSLAILRTSRRKDDAWKLIEFLTAKETQLRFYALSGDLPSRLAAWEDPVLRDDPKARAFAVQLRHVKATPKVPEWESITTRVTDHLEAVIRGRVALDEALARMDADTDRILEKRRWLLRSEARDAR